MLTKWMANLRASADFDFAGTGNVDSRITGASGASLATLVDSTGKITYKPNNAITQTDFSSGWTFRGFGARTTGQTDPVGGTAAVSWTENNTDGNPAIFMTSGSPATINQIFAVWLRASTPVTINLSSQGTTSPGSINVTTIWQRFYVKQLGDAFVGPHIGGFATITRNSLVTIYAYKPRLSAVTYETTPRAADDVDTAGSAYYGPRINYDPATLARLGLRVEEARTNLALTSGNIGSASWTDQNTSRTAAFATSPDGTNTATRAQWVAGSNQFIYQGIALTSGTTYAISAYVKSNTAGTQLFRFHSFSGGSNLSADFTATTTWQRFIYVFTPGATATFNTGFYNDSTNTAADLQVWGFQVEATTTRYPGPTSYIPTGASTATRVADAPVVSDISGIYNPTEGAIAVTCTPPGDYNQLGLVVEAASSSADNIFISKSDAVATSAGKRWVGYVQTTASGTVATIATGSNGAAIIAKLAMSYAANDFVFDAEGAQVGTDTSGTLPAPSALSIGLRTAGGNNHWFNGDIGRVRIYKKKPNASQLLAMVA